MRQFYIHNFRTKRAKIIDRTLHQLADLIIQPLAKKCSRNTDLFPLNVVVERCSMVPDRYICGGRITMVASGNDVQHLRNIAAGLTKNADIIKRRSKGNEPVSRNSSVRRLEPDNPAQRR